MIDFYIINNNKIIEEIINKVMMKYDYIYNIKYNNIEEIDTYKIYIINDNQNKYKLLNLLKRIRYKNNDWKSMIIILSNNSNKIINYIKDYMIIQIAENNNQLEQGIIKSINNFDQHPKTLKYKYKNTYYNIDLKNIVYIEKEKDNKRCIIHTQYNNYYIQGTLSNIINKLDNRFKKCSRSYILNLEQVNSYDKKNNIIKMNNNDIITEISRNKKKEIYNYFRNVE